MNKEQVSQIVLNFSKHYTGKKFEKWQIEQATDDCWSIIDACSRSQSEIIKEVERYISKAKTTLAKHLNESQVNVFEENPPAYGLFFVFCQKEILEQFLAELQANPNETELKGLISRIADKYIDIAPIKEEAKPFAEQECMRWYDFFSDIPEEVNGKIKELKLQIAYHRKLYCESKSIPGNDKERVIYVDENNKIIGSERRQIVSDDALYRHVRFKNSVLIDFLKEAFTGKKMSLPALAIYIRFEKPELLGGRERLVEIAKEYGYKHTSLYNSIVAYDTGSGKDPLRNPKYLEEAIKFLKDGTDSKVLAESKLREMRYY